MILYHGSYAEIENIDFSFCKNSRDFGKGFYVTKLREQADFWAKRKAKEYKTEPFITEYNFDEYWFEDEFLKVLRFSDYSGEWLDFVVANRKNRKTANFHDYDIIEGPVADDEITTRVNAYLRGIITKEQFLIDLTHNPSHQICFCTMRSLQALEQDKYDIDSKIMAIDKQVIKALLTEKKMTEMEAADKYYTSNTYAQLSDETTQFYTKNWIEIYELLLTEIN